MTIETPPQVTRRCVGLTAPEFSRERTVITIMHFLPDGSEVCETYRREGALQASEQLTSFTRDSTVSFWGLLHKEKE